MIALDGQGIAFAAVAYGYGLTALVVIGVAEWIRERHERGVIRRAMRLDR
jgi:hypothetical protein